MTEQKRSPKVINWVVGIGLSLVLVGCIAAYIWTYQTASMDLAQTGTQSVGTGTFGDAFGFLNAAFTGLALAGLIVSIFLQRAELTIVKSDRKDAKETLKIQTKMNARLEADLNARVLEDRFFKLLNKIDETNANVAANYRDHDVIRNIYSASTTEYVEVDGLKHYIWNTSKSTFSNGHFKRAYMGLLTEFQVIWSVVSQIKDPEVASQFKLLLLSSLNEVSATTIYFLLDMSPSSTKIDAMEALEDFAALNLKVMKTRQERLDEYATRSI